MFNYSYNLTNYWINYLIQIILIAIKDLVQSEEFATQSGVNLFLSYETNLYSEISLAKLIQ